MNTGRQTANRGRGWASTWRALGRSAVSLLAACSPAGNNSDFSSGDREIVPARVASFPRQSSGITDRRRIAIRNAAEWADFWQQVTASESPAAPVPEVDFSQHMVIAAALGERPSGGYTVEIAGISASNGRPVATVVERAPGPDCITTSALTQPVDAVIVPNEGLNVSDVTFAEQRRVEACR